MQAPVADIGGQLEEDDADEQASLGWWRNPILLDAVVVFALLAWIRISRSTSRDTSSPCSRNLVLLILLHSPAAGIRHQGGEKDY